MHFYPRPPRGGRLFSVVLHPAQSDFYPRPPRGGRPSTSRRAAQPQPISIHALREEGDATRPRRRDSTCTFLSTPSARRATSVSSNPFAVASISIHALREEGDVVSGHQRLTVLNFYPRPPRGGRPALSACCFRGSLDFYPRPPRGGRRDSPLIVHAWSEFLSTPSARRATSCYGWHGAKILISIHALREEGDSMFQCRSRGHGRISIHALREEGDGADAALGTAYQNFYPRPPRGGRRLVRQSGFGLFRFLSTPSARRATLKLH